MASTSSSDAFAYDMTRNLNPVIKSGRVEQPHDDAAAVREFQAAFERSVSSYHEPSAFAAAIDVFKHMNSVDDRKMALEHLIAFLSKHADGALKDQVHELENKLIKLLYDDLYHPPATYLGTKYSYRRQDGSFNSLSDPEMGKAYQPYARSVQQKRTLPQNMFPDAGLVFDTLLKREKFVRHPAGLSSFMFSFAALVVHTIFRTSHSDVTINETSSYVDLAPLYGNNEETLNLIRVRNGRGLLLPDTFAEERLLLLPPACCALLVLFNRNHNYIASKLLEINERNTWTDPDEIPLNDLQREMKLADQDEEIFQTARLINCSWFASIVLSDYVSSILGLVRQGSTWSLNPFEVIRESDHKLFERGRGHVCSVEFNSLYRWHATTSEADEKWVENLMARTFPGQSVTDLTVTNFYDAVRKLHAAQKDLSQWTFGNLKRGEDGRFKDSELAALIKDAIEHPAAAFGARGTPHIMRLHEIMGIETNRRWGVCSLNEFRKFLCLKPYTSFLEWNSNPEIAEAAERLYHDIDNLELYAGLQAEEAKPVVDGAGLCPGYTISRAILSDAIALTRGDRFFTTDYNPANLTAWGFADSQRDVKGPGHGGMLGRLFLRGLPGEFTEKSAYTWFALQTPESMKVFLERLGTAHRYDFNRPSVSLATVTVREHDEVRQVLDSALFRPSCVDKARRVVSGQGFFLASNNDVESQRDQQEVLHVLQGEPDQSEKIPQYFYERIRNLIMSKSFTVSDKVKMLDIVRDVLRYAPLHWTATEVAGLRLKADEQSLGDYTESQLYEMITDIYSFLFLDVDPSKAINLEERVKEHIKDLQWRIKANIMKDVGGRFSLAGLVGTVQSFLFAKARKQNLSVAASLYASGISVDRATNNVLSLLIGASVELSQSTINTVNFYLDQPNVVSKLLAADAKNAAVEDHIYKALRIDPPFRGVYRESLADQEVGNLSIRKGQRVFVDLAHASWDPDTFHGPTAVIAYRESSDRCLARDGVIRSLGVELTVRIVGQVLSAVFGFDGLRRGPGLSGTLKRHKVTEGEKNTLLYEYLGSDNLPTPWPNSMIVQMNSEVEDWDMVGA